MILAVTNDIIMILKQKGTKIIFIAIIVFMNYLTNCKNTNTSISFTFYPNLPHNNYILQLKIAQQLIHSQYY